MKISIRHRTRDKDSVAYILVLAITRCAVSVVETFHHLRPQNVVRTCDVEPCPLIKLCLVGRHLGLVPAEAFRTDSSKRAVVGVLTSFYKRQPKVDVFLLFQDQTSEDEVAAVEAGEMTGFEGESSAVESGEEGQIRT